MFARCLQQMEAKVMDDVRVIATAAGGERLLDK
jgi:hypothetical protein